MSGGQNVGKQRFQEVVPVTTFWLLLTAQNLDGVATFSVQILSDTSFNMPRTGFFGGQVPGRQTVPRAELWGAIQILSRVDEKSNIQIPIDAKCGTSGITQKGDLEQGPNGDLWSILFQLIDRRSGVTDVVKVKSQLDVVGPSVITHNKVGFHHVQANSLADVVTEYLT